MKNFTKCLAAGAAIGGLSAPVAAQNGYGYQQPYPQQSYPAYGQQGYGYSQGYAQNPVGQIIDQLLGNRYNVTDRQAVSQCASAAMTQAAAQYGNGYNGGYGYNNGYRQGYRSAMRVTAITDVRRRSNGLRVSGLMSSGGGYGGQYGYQNRGYATGDVSFRCNVDNRGQVTNIRIGRNNGYRG
jgi:hypothetical protein